MMNNSDTIAGASMQSPWRISWTALLITIAAGPLTLTGCRGGGSNGTSGPPTEGEPQVMNVADDFYFRWTSLSGITANRQYSWTWSGGTANVTQTSSGLTSTDSVKLIIRNQSGAEVYRGDLRVVGAFTATSTNGTHTIRIELRTASGTIDFRVRKAT